jgi:hypothetical protein
MTKQKGGAMCAKKRVQQNIGFCNSPFLKNAICSVTGKLYNTGIFVFIKIFT